MKVYGVEYDSGLTGNSTDDIFKTKTGAKKFKKRYGGKIWIGKARKSDVYKEGKTLNYDDHAGTLLKEKYLKKVI